MTREGELLWTPDEQRRSSSRLAAFMGWAAAREGRSLSDYDEVLSWSLEDLEGFWSSFAEWYGLRWQTTAPRALGRAEMPGAQSCPGRGSKYRAHVLYPPAGADKDDVAVVFAREDGLRRTMTWRELRTEVAAVRSWLVETGVQPGDRVAALLPNSPHALVAMLATASLGAVWSSCSPDFGSTAVADRFTQIEPVVLLTVDGYYYGGKRFDITSTVEELRAQLPSVRATVLVSYLGGDGVTVDDVTPWEVVVSQPATLAFEPVAFDAPLYVLYSSGTTGLPKPIVHGHGGILVEHAKQLGLHLDLGPGDRFFWFSTTGWMMWNLLVSGLAVGSAVVLYDGSPAFPDQMALWRLAEEVGITHFGVSAPYLQACMKADLHPGRDLDLSLLRAVGSTGAPLPPEGFAWVYDEVKQDVMLSSLSGGTDVCTAFVGGAPLLPVHAGEIPARLLGCKVEAYDENAHPVIGEVGELVISAPMPSMPVKFWNDPDGSRLREAYFDTYPGVWRHGDWIKFTERGSCVIYGRSDSTLNRGGVRMGTSEFYRVVEDSPDVVDSLVIDTSAAGAEGRLLLFVVLREGAELDAVSAELKTRIRSQLSPRHVPDEIRAIPEVPRTLNNKKCEVPVKRILSGVPVDKAVSEGALANPRAMEPFLALRATCQRLGSL